MSQEIKQLALQLTKTLEAMDKGTVNLVTLTNVFNDHIDRIVMLERRMTILEGKIKSQTDTMPGVINDVI